MHCNPLIYGAYDSDDVSPYKAIFPLRKNSIAIENEYFRRNRPLPTAQTHFYAAAAAEEEEEEPYKLTIISPYLKIKEKIQILAV